MKEKARTITPPGADYQIHVIGEHPRPLMDFYHGLMRLSWTATLFVVACAFTLTNALFALGFLATGGIAHSDGTFADAFFFSVQTMGTIGYGAMFPASRAANELVVLESIVSLILTALTTGLVFAKFSRPTARVVFTKEAVISPVNGVPMLMLRLGNERGNQIVDASIRAVMLRTEQLAEGGSFYRMVDLKLTRDHALSLNRSWSVMHPIDEKSPLFGETPETFVEKNVEVQVMLVGLDDTSMQIIHASHRYFSRQILWGRRHVDVLTELDDGAMQLDLRRFHTVEPSVPTREFPYPSP